MRRATPVTMEGIEKVVDKVVEKAFKKIDQRFDRLEREVTDLTEVVAEIKDNMVTKSDLNEILRSERRATSSKIDSTRDSLAKDIADLRMVAKKHDRRLTHLEGGAAVAG